MTTEITRREAVQRAAWLLGCAVSAPTILGALANWESVSTRGVARTLTFAQRATVVSIADLIIPETDTPGARAARVDEFIDAMLTTYYPAEDRERFLSGLARVDARARRAHGKDFTKITRAQRTQIVTELDRLAFTETESDNKPKEPVKADVAAGQGVGANPREAATPPPDKADVGSKSFFRMIKELTVVGYYTSEVGSTRELRPMPWGRYRDIPYKPGTPAWA